jgi:hypothetical protein
MKILGELGGLLNIYILTCHCTQVLQPEDRGGGMVRGLAGGKLRIASIRGLNLP